MPRDAETGRARPLPVQPIHRIDRASRVSSASLTAVVLQTIRQAILDAKYALSEALSEVKLATALGVSRTPVREALNALQQQGLIVIKPQNGSFIFMPSEEDVGELCEFRRILEVDAIRFCLARRKSETLTQMREATAAMDAAIGAEDHLAYARADTAFHQAIAENSANDYVIYAYPLVSGRVAALRAHNLTGSRALRTKSMAEHRAIIAAFAKGDLPTVDALRDEHITRMATGYRAVKRRKTPVRLDGGVRGESFSGPAPSDDRQVRVPSVGK